MQFSIPKWESVSQHNSNGHQVFLIYLNGFLHSKTRYSQLLDLHLKLKSNYPDILDLLEVKFPPRHLMLLSSSELESRRDKLETYLQVLSQCAEITTGPELTSFLMKQQCLTFAFSEEPQPLPITMPDHSITTLNISLASSSVTVLLKLGETLQIPKDYLFAFKFVLIELQVKVLTYHKLLLSCECPALVLLAAKQEKPNAHYGILLRKMLSSTELENQIIENSVVRKLIADEIRQDLRYSFCLPKDVKNFPKHKFIDKSDESLLGMAHKLRYCGYIRFQLCAANFPEEKTYVVPRFGRYEIRFEYNQNDGTRVCASFKVCRIKCWSVGEITQVNCYKQFMYRYELCFEYYLSKDRACLVKVLTNEAVMMSLCIQQMIDETSLINNQKGISADSMSLLEDHEEIEIDEIRSEETVSLNTLSSVETTQSHSNSHSGLVVHANNNNHTVDGNYANDSCCSEYNAAAVASCQSGELGCSWPFNQSDDPAMSTYPFVGRFRGSFSKENVTFERANLDCDL